MNDEEKDKMEDRKKDGADWQKNTHKEADEDAEEHRRLKTRRSAESVACGCLLFYFISKSLVLLVLHKYNNYLTLHPYLWIPFILILILTSYLMLTTGNDPGFLPIESEDEESAVLTEPSEKITNSSMVPTHCKICCCNMPNRCKHCYKCGRCVLKYDHHCPWIGACVGEYNHCKFWFMLLCHTCQAIFGMIIVKCMYYIVFTIDDDVLIEGW